MLAEQVIGSAWISFPAVRCSAEENVARRRSALATALILSARGKLNLIITLLWLIYTSKLPLLSTKDLASQTSQFPGKAAGWFFLIRSCLTRVTNNFNYSHEKTFQHVGTEINTYSNEKCEQCRKRINLQIRATMAKINSVPIANDLNKAAEDSLDVWHVSWCCWLPNRAVSGRLRKCKFVVY